MNGRHLFNLFWTRSFLLNTTTWSGSVWFSYSWQHDLVNHDSTKSSVNNVTTYKISSVRNVNVMSAVSRLRRGHEFITKDPNKRRLWIDQFLFETSVRAVRAERYTDFSNHELNNRQWIDRVFQVHHDQWYTVKNRKNHLFRSDPSCFVGRKFSHCNDRV